MGGAPVPCMLQVGPTKKDHGSERLWFFLKKKKYGLSIGHQSSAGAVQILVYYSTSIL
jgi:hypothetical protein